MTIKYDISAAKWSFVMIFLLLTNSAMAAGDSPFNFGVQSFITSDDNIGRSQFDADREKDTLLSVNADTSYTKGLGAKSAVNFVGFVRVEEFSDFDGLSNTQGGVTIDLRFQFSQSFSAARYSFFYRATGMDFETDIRDGDMGELGISAAKRITNKITLALGATASERTADGEAFDLERIRYFTNMDWQFSHRSAVYLNYSYIDGDVFSTATPTLALITWADAIEPDNAFGGIANNKFAYRLDANTRIWRLGLNVGINPGTSFDISVDSLDSQAKGSLEYDLLSVTAGFLFHF